MMDGPASDDAVKAIGQAYHAYIDGLPKLILTVLDGGRPLDMAEVGFWRFPLLDLTTAPADLMAAGDFADRTIGAYRSYRLDGWAGHLNVDAAEIRLVGARHALMHGRGSRYRADGSLIDRWDTGYVLERTDGIWRACVLLPATLLQARDVRVAEWLAVITAR